MSKIVVPAQDTDKKNWQVRVLRSLLKRLKILCAELDKTQEQLTEEGLIDLLKKYGK